MRLDINIEKRQVIVLVLIGLFAIGIAGVYAYNPSVFGHSPGELDWTQIIESNVLINGKLGVGTSVPGAKIHINGTGYAGMFVENSGKKFSFYANNAGNLVIGDEVAGTARIIVNGSTGNIGIGTASPTQKLEVSGNIRAQSIISASGTINASRICIGTDCKTAWPSGAEAIGVDSGTVANGASVPLPSGFIESECHWVVAHRTPGESSGGGMDYTRAYTTGRVVTCTWSKEDSGTVHSDSCAYLIICKH